MKLTANPDNTAVITLIAYHQEKIPPTTKFFVNSALLNGLKIIPMGKGEEDGYSKGSFYLKTHKMREWIEQLDPRFEFVLYTDARDVLYTRPIEDICEEYNNIGSEILMSAEPWAYPHCHPDWEKLHPQFPSGFNYPNAGCFIASRGALERALRLAEYISERIKDGSVYGMPPHFHNDDQILWQVMYVNRWIPMVVDHESRIFSTVTNTRFDLYDFTKSREESPVVLKNGSRPCIMHFPGGGVAAMPFAAWTLNLSPLPKA